MPADDPRQRQPDISAARRLLDWEPEVSLEEELGRTIAHFQERLRKAL
jgi:nucleoside-diphosphate-sugar epimerase